MAENKKFNYGGQAVIEGVMMRGSRSVAVAVRNPQNKIVIHIEPLNQAVYGGKLIKTPFVRGLVMLWDALGLGIKALMFSADVSADEEGSSKPAEAFSKPVQIGTILLSLSMSIGLFFVLPAFLGGLVESWLGGTQSATYWSHLAEGAVRLLLLIGYVSLIGLMEDVRRLYGYHGAEHKTINAYEAGAELTPAKVAQYPIEHPRCGTAFLLTVVIISIILFTLIPLEPLEAIMHPILARILTRIALLPIVAGLAYEYIRFSAKHLDNPIIKLLTKPNLALQHLTTKEPDETMLEVAIAAFESMMAYEQGEEPVIEQTVIIGQPALGD
jgi:uncharacterized protein YqhQ